MSHRALASLLLVTACATPPIPSTSDPRYAMTDGIGHVYPLECRRDLSHIKTPIQYVPRSTLRELSAELPSKSTIGLCLHCTLPVADLILVADDLTPEDSAMVVHHERCHRQMYLLGKDVNWHSTDE